MGKSLADCYIVFVIIFFFFFDERYGIYIFGDGDLDSSLINTFLEALLVLCSPLLEPQKWFLMLVTEEQDLVLREHNPIVPLQKDQNTTIKETDHVFGLTYGTKSYPVGIVRDVEVHIRRLKLLNDFYIIDMKKDPKTTLLVRRGFMATANAVIGCRKAKIAVGEGITRLVFEVKETNPVEEEAPYWTTLGKKESYKLRPSSNSVGFQTPYYARKEFMDCHLPREWEIARDSKINSFKDVLVFRRMVEFLGALPINLKGNMWESNDLIENLIN
uniref:MAK10-like protein n=1 Tax=Tanacetum cinerariifolium TaxID=118510 RepID=A0A6L2P021_TANCI|nr:hypothetical protein [Tanacetum cinerariifolium]